MPEPNKKLTPEEKINLFPRLREEAQTIEIMVQAYCNAHHKTKDNELCAECEKFLTYAKMRLGRCPYGENKPVCGKCKIHCYKLEQREKAKVIMQYSGPRLIIKHPILLVKHLLYSLKKAPDKPRNPNLKNSQK